MKKINFLFAVHNHQPVGNFDHVIEHAYRCAYQPFLDLLEKHPTIEIALHYTGNLAEWLFQHHPTILKQLKRLVKRKQVELMTGAYYEAILPIIPDEDKIGQITKLTKFLQKQFEYQPTGMWLAERVWEQHLTKPIAQAGVRSVVIDDTHFQYAGLKDNELLGYYITEELGTPLHIFPSSKILRYALPFKPVRAAVDYLRSLATENGTRIVVYADDGEKFGLWPHTYQHVYENGWLEDFFKALEDNSDWINLLHFSEALQTINPIGRVYLPSASYPEMMHWALPSHSFGEYEEFEKRLRREGMLNHYGRFVRGGFWRNFLVKYPEANNLHKKMLRISERAHLLKQKGHNVSKALNYLWAGQCNDPYWHGIFGGLYLPNLRSPAYRNLILAEKELDKVEKQKSICIEQTDFDRDGFEELLVESNKMDLYFKLDQGGSLFELDFKPISFNLLDVMTRREEGYHQKVRGVEKNHRKNSTITSIHDLVLRLTKERSLKQHLSYDWYCRASLIDHFLGHYASLEGFAQCRYPEQGDFVNQPYLVKVNRAKEGVKIRLHRDGGVWVDDTHWKLRVTKTISVKKDSSDLLIDYRIENLRPEAVDLWFGIEFNYGLLAGDAPDRYYSFPNKVLDDRRLKSCGIVDGVKSIQLVDEWLKLQVGLEFKAPSTVWRFPVETVSLSEKGLERVYQSSVVFPNWKIHLMKDWRFQIRQTITHG